MYLPKEGLSGDYFWVRKVNSEEKGKVVIAAVGDCTGHGVPGALLSILGINYFNIASRSSDINNCVEALDLVNNGVIQIFEGNSKKDSISDGMDAAMVSINKNTLNMNYATAINPIYILRNEEIIILKGDVIYLFSDGFADQFWGEKDKKFSYKSFREVLTANHSKSMEEQGVILEKTILDWKGTGEQTDDICVIGLKV